MKQSVIIGLFALTLCVGMNTAQGQSTNACPGLHNPTTFNAVTGGAGSWSARVGERISTTSTSDTTTGYYVMSTCADPNCPAITGHANITSTTYNTGSDAGITCCNHGNIWDGNDRRFQIITQANAGVDEFTINGNNSMQRIPPGHTSCIRLGDPRASYGQLINSHTWSSSRANKSSEALFYTMRVNAQNALLFIDYAVVGRCYSHQTYQAGEFLIRVVKQNADGSWPNAPINDSMWFKVSAPPIPSGNPPSPWVMGKPGSSCGSTTCAYVYKPWAKAAISLIDYVYENVRIEMYTSDCIYDVDPLYAYIAGSCQPMQITTSGCPAGESTAVDTLVAPDGLLTYTWYVSSTGYSGVTTNTEFMDGLHFRQVQAASSNNVYVARANDFIVTEGANAGDTVGVTTYKCVMTSAMDPSKPFHSRIYATVSNTKPVINAHFDKNCYGDGSYLEMRALGRVPFQGENAPTIVDSLTQWVIYQGSTPDTPPLDTLYGINASYFFANEGNYAVKLSMFTEDSTCYTSKVYLVHIDVPPTNVIDIDKRTLCVGEQATITDLTQNITSRRWEFADTTIDSEVSGMANTRVVVRDFTEFENPFMLITRNAADCVDTLYDTIYFFHDPEIIFSNDTVICNGHESHVRVSTPVSGCTFEWYRHYDRDGETPVCTGDVLYARPTQPTTKYYVKIIAPAGCVVWDSITLSLLSTKIVANPPHAKHCPGDSVMLTGQGALWYEWSSSPDDPDLAAQAHNSTITVSPQVDTRYYMVGYAADSCDIAAISILVQNVPVPVVDMSYSPHYIDTETPVVSFTDLSEGRDHTQWLFGDGATSSGETVTHYFDIYSDSCNYVTMKSYNEIGCYADTSWMIEIDTFGFYRPNVFTPNKTQNNTFYVVCPSAMDEFHIAIFNRRGSLVYSSDDQHFAWDGSLNGKPLPQGAYAYVITYSRAGSVQQYRLHGVVTLIR